MGEREEANEEARESETEEPRGAVSGEKVGITGGGRIPDHPLREENPTSSL